MPKLLLLLMVFLTGCTIRAPQLAYLFDEGPTQNPLAEYQWTLSYGAYQKHVYAIEVPKGLVFANEFDDALLFDGKEIIRVVKIGQELGFVEVSHQILAVGGVEKVFTTGNKSVMTHQCTGWILTTPLNYEQQCHTPLGQRYVNKKRYSKSGELVMLQMVLGDIKHSVSITRGLLSQG